MASDFVATVGGVDAHRVMIVDHDSKGLVRILCSNRARVPRDNAHLAYEHTRADSIIFFDDKPPFDGILNMGDSISST